MKISILGSGSGGNSTYIESEKGKILVDAGFSCKKIEERLNFIERELNDINGILITHEHIDHIQGAGIISRKYNIPIYITPESFKAGESKLGKINPENLRFIKDKFIINDSLLVKPFDVMHDAQRTVGYRIESQSGKVIAISTDIGYVNNIVRENFKAADVMIIESNYDYNMLMNCNYPWDLKARVKGRNGHLSNNEAAKFIKEMYNENLKKVYLAHISKDSNNPDIVKDTIAQELRANKINLDYELAKQDVATKLFEI
ncbi:MBL fold metallo-hydrolase [uncultured Fusobacterium sp.]|uniref:MBL fold metallo-hydrolase n=1 Tax=uncultured Fusobacterium sp. TaxID=159267 RepID=UPI0025D27F26|nr:MBL fold metallo-hydrolase [uncultured Fusobacterium sp.]